MLSAWTPGTQLRIDESRSPPAALPSAGGTALRAAPPAPGPAEWGSPTSADSEPRRGPFGSLGVLGPRLPSTGFWAPSCSL
eukprot:15469563-Alexandrium_andersonii.AAC.1